MAKPKVFSGFTAASPEKLLLDAGAFFKNFVVGTDSFDSAVTAGKLIGATQGGGTFSAVPTVRRIEIDGVKGAAKGLEVIDEWAITIMANVKEVSVESIKLALGAASSEYMTGYQKITANNYIQSTDYNDNVVWIGKLSGTNTPVIIEVLNAISLGGLTLTMADKAEGLISTTFTGHYTAASLDSPPFNIYYPDAVVNTVDDATHEFSKASAADITLIITSSDGAVCNGVRKGTDPMTAGEFTLGEGTVILEKEYLGTLTNGEYIFNLVMNLGNNIPVTITITA